MRGWAPRRSPPRREKLAEFTGERIIPGKVDPDLLNEHLARYAFAARLSRGKRVLDAGCGAGYGSVELARHALSVAGVDASADAIEFARENYRLPNLTFERASVEALPHPDASFEMVVAFEVIEHLENWRAFLLEARRVLAPSGQFIVSTPNRLYYAETRERAGPNPFHVHEFEFAEFREELSTVFPHILMFLENHVEGVVFQPVEPGDTAEVRIDAGDVAAAESHFFVAVCAHRTQTGNPSFVYVPKSANVLRERERHIELLASELETKNGWLERSQQELAELNGEHQKLLEMFRAQQAEMERRNEWALALNAQLEEAGAQIKRLEEALATEQAEARRVVAAYEDKVAELERENQAKTAWALETEQRLGREIEDKGQELARCVEILHQVEKTVEERTAWAGRLQAEGDALRRRIAMFEASRWVKLGRQIGLGPRNNA